MTARKLLYPFLFFRLQISELFTQGNTLEKFLFFTSCVSSLALFFYSYTQIDLGLVITRVTWLYAIEKKFQYIGYFNRPLSTLFFVLLTIIISCLYFFILACMQKKKVKAYTIWSIIGIVTLILAFAYNAFSYDLFNYIFDAKIFTHYHQNPYLHKALDYPGDPMLGFMHWTHRTYPYGPFWIGITIPVSFIGANIFIITFLLFKIVMAVSFLILVYYLYQIVKLTNKKSVLENLLIFALNPLVLFESLISAHNDIVMMAFAVAALFYLLKKRYWLSFLLLVLSIGLKFATIALLPVFFFVLFMQSKKKIINFDSIFVLCFACMVIPLYFVTARTNFQPWYLLYILPFASLIEQEYLRYTTVFVSIISIFLYTSFFATGDWHSIWYTTPENIFYWLVTLAALAGLLYIMYTIYRGAFARKKV